MLRYQEKTDAIFINWLIVYCYTIDCNFVLMLYKLITD
jgi:hypothetical protein